MTPGPSNTRTEGKRERGMKESSKHPLDGECPPDHLLMGLSLEKEHTVSPATCCLGSYKDVTCPWSQKESMAESETSKDHEQ